MLQTRPYQVAISTDPTLPLRKWDHKGTFHAYSHLSAAYEATDFTGNHVHYHQNHGLPGTLFKFDTGVFVHVGF